MPWSPVRPRRYGACQRWLGQCTVRRNECFARPIAAGACRWAHAVVRKRTAWRAQSADPLGPGNERSGCARPPAHQVGLRTAWAEQVEDIVDRAVAITSSDPTGPVYISLPREALAQETELSEPVFPGPQPIKLGAPPQADIEIVAERLVAAARPLIIANGCGQFVAETEALIALVDAHAIPVVASNAAFVALPEDHPAHGGFVLGADLARPTQSWSSIAMCLGFRAAKVRETIAG